MHNLLKYYTHRLLYYVLYEWMYAQYVVYKTPQEKIMHSYSDFTDRLSKSGTYNRDLLGTYYLLIQY